jgi:hypothetical protein
MMLVAFRIAILAASSVVPRDRAAWRRAWTAEIRHYATLLHARGMRNRYVRIRTWHHFIGAMRDAGRLFSQTPAAIQFRAALRTPAFCLGLIALGLTAMAAASHGFAITRSMLAPPYPDARRLVLISQGGVLQNQRHTIPPPLLDFWKTHNTTLAGLAGYQWNTRGTAWVTPDFFAVLGARPRCFLLRRIHDWRPLANQPDMGNALGVIGRLKPGVDAANAQTELRGLAARYRGDRQSSASGDVQVMPLVNRIRQPFYAYAGLCAVPAVLLLAGACIGVRTEHRRLGRIRGRYWAFYCAKAISLPVALALAIWEFSRATSFTPAGSATFVAKPFFIWLVILACGAIVWWCLADQRARCRACLRTLQYPVRIGSLGAVLFDHAGMELMCCQGHGALYLPAVSSDYVQPGGWTALDAEDITSEPVHGGRA